MDLLGSRTDPSVAAVAKTGGQYVRWFCRTLSKDPNWLFTAAVIGWGGALGSAIAFLLSGAIIWNLIELARRKLDLRVERAAYWIALAFACFFIVEILSGLINWSYPETPIEVLANIPFLGFILIYAALAKSQRSDISKAVQFGVVSGAFAALMIALVEVSVFGLPRASGLAGNPGPFAVITALLYCLCLVTAAQQEGGKRLLALLGSVAAAVCVLLSGMRGLWPVLALAPLISLFIFRPKILLVQPTRVFAVSTILLVAVGYLSLAVIKERVLEIAYNYDRIIHHSDYNNSIGRRLKMWEAGIRLVAERPLLGHGPGNIRQVMKQRTGNQGDTKLAYSHFHNFLVNTAVRSGFLGVISLLSMFFLPLWLAFREPRNATANTGLAMMLSIHLTFLMSGLSNIMLHHDIMDTLFIFGTATSSLLVFRSNEATGTPA